MGRGGRGEGGRLSFIYLFAKSGEIGCEIFKKNLAASKAFFLFFSSVCEECQDLHYGDCPVHGPLTVVDDSEMTERIGGVSSFVSRASLPENMEIRPSVIPNSGLGIFSTKVIDKGVRLGPYKGKKLRLEDIADDTDTCYMWEVSMG